MVDNVEVVTGEEIRARQAALLEKYPRIAQYEPGDCSCPGVWCGNAEWFGGGEIQAIEEMARWEWLAGGGSWDWLVRHG